MSMAEPKTASINISKALVNISLTTIAAIGSAAGIPWIAGATALPAAIAASGTLGIFLNRKKEEQLELPAPPFWTRDAQSWQVVCSSIEYHLPTIMDTMATQLKQVQGLPTQAIVKQTLIQAIAQHLPTWEIPAQERGSIAVYVAPLIFMKTAEMLQPILDQVQRDAQGEMVGKIFDLLNRAQQAELPPISSVVSAMTPTTPVVSSVATVLEQKMQASAYDVYICYNEEDEAEVFPIGEALKANGILPWFDFLGKPGRFKGKQQEHLIENIPAAAIFVGQYAIKQWQELQMYAFLDQFVERECPVIPVLLKSAPSKPKLPPFLATFVWVDFHRSVPDPIQQFIWGIGQERSVHE
jgi:TIR domain